MNDPHIELVTRKDCPECREVKSWLSSRNIPFEEHVIDENITKEAVHERFPWATKLPICAIDDVPIGGKMEIIRWIVEYLRTKK